MCDCPNKLRQDEDLDPKEYPFFLERISKHMYAGPHYFKFFAALTAVLQVCRFLMDYVAIVWELGLSTDELVVYWTSHWLPHLWPISLLLALYSIGYLRDYTLVVLNKIRFRLKEYPICALKRVYSGKIQHIIPIGFLIICVSFFACAWFLRSSSTLILGSVEVTFEVTETPLSFWFGVIWITWGWLIGGYLSWACISVIIISKTTSSRIKSERIDVLNSDRAGGFSLMGSLAMRSAMLYIFSVSIMLPGWIFSSDVYPIFSQISVILLLGVLSSLGIMEVGLFLLPMYFFHEKMKEAKERFLDRFDTQIAGIYKPLPLSITQKREGEESESDANMQLALHQIAECLEVESKLALRKEARSMHEYPFNPRMLAKVSSSAILPLLIVVLQRAVEYGLGLAF